MIKLAPVALLLCVSAVASWQSTEDNELSDDDRGQLFAANLITAVYRNLSSSPLVIGPIKYPIDIGDSQGVLRSPGGRWISSSSYWFKEAKLKAARGPPEKESFHGVLLFSGLNLTFERLILEFRGVNVTTKATLAVSSAAYTISADLRNNNRCRLSRVRVSTESIGEVDIRVGYLGEFSRSEEAVSGVLVKAFESGLRTWLARRLTGFVPEADSAPDSTRNCDQLFVAKQVWYKH